MQISRRALSGGLGLSVLAAPLGAMAETADRPSRRAVRSILRDRVAHVSAGENDFAIAAGWIGEGRRSFASFGQLNQGGSRSANDETRFEIGSLTKAFTAIALADMAVRGELALDDPANRHLPERLQLADRNARPVTLLELATHTAGLPFMPPEAALATRADAEAWVRTLRTENTGWDYSNVGYWLLGEALAARAGARFEDVLRARVIEPLELDDTSFAAQNYAVGHDAAMRQAPEIASLPGFGFMSGAGGLFSSVKDILTVAAVAMGQQRSSLSPAIALTISTRVAGPSSAQTQALGWSVVSGADELVLRDGGTLGSASCVVWSPQRQLGMVVLSNQVTAVADIARHILDPAFPLADVAAARHVEVSLSQEALDAFAGSYLHEEEGAFIVARDGDGLLLTLPEPWGLPPLQLRAEGATEFFALALPLRAHFQRNSEGRVTGMLVYPPRGQNALPTTRAP